MQTWLWPQTFSLEQSEHSGAEVPASSCPGPGAWLKLCTFTPGPLKCPTSALVSFLCLGDWPLSGGRSHLSGWDAVVPPSLPGPQAHCNLRVQCIYVAQVSRFKVSVIAFKANIENISEL